MGKTTDINVFFVTFIPIFNEGIDLSILLVADNVLGLKVGALACTFLFEFFVHEQNAEVVIAWGHRLFKLEVEGVKEWKLYFIEDNLFSIIVEASLFALMISVPRHLLM